MSKVSLLPNIFTAANLLLGVMAIINIIDGNYALSVALILGAALIDRFDGRIARRYHAETDFGREFDSLADVISFGLAPAVLLYAVLAGESGLAGQICCCLFALCGGLRLARYNLTGAAAYYQGVPITFCGSVLALLVLLTPDRQALLLTASFILSLAMLSKIHIPKL